MALHGRLSLRLAFCWLPEPRNHRRFAWLLPLKPTDSTVQAISPSCFVFVVINFSLLYDAIKVLSFCLLNCSSIAADPKESSSQISLLPSSLLPCFLTPPTVVSIPWSVRRIFPPQLSALDWLTRSKTLSGISLLLTSLCIVYISFQFTQTLFRPS